MSLFVPAEEESTSDAGETEPGKITSDPTDKKNQTDSTNKTNSAAGSKGSTGSSSTKAGSGVKTGDFAGVAWPAAGVCLAGGVIAVLTATKKRTDKGR